MYPEDEYFYTLTKAEIWQRYCGFLDLSIDEFMDIQKELLMDEVERVAQSTLGKKIMGNRKPMSIDEFRNIVPITTYDDYEPYLSEQREDALAEKPYCWCHSSGKGGKYKWIPHSSEIMEKAIIYSLAGIILASSRKKGDINIDRGIRVLALFGPPPYGSGTLLRYGLQRFSWRIMPPVEEFETAEFQDRIQKAFQLAIRDGVDIVSAIASVMVKMGEQFTAEGRQMKFSPFMLHPKVASRLLLAWLRSKRERRSILPKDIWHPKGILVSGVDTAIYKDEVAYYWGITPHELYAGTEAMVYALQGWNSKGLIFFPDTAFLEFIRYEELTESTDNRDRHSSTLLLNELEEGELYELVITNFYGMPLLRYRINDVIKVISTKDDGNGVNLPQIAFQRRVGDVINLGGLCWLDEKTIWQAIANTGIKYTEWTAYKEYGQGKSFLRILLELNEDREIHEIETSIDQQLVVVDTEYKDVHSHLDLQPIRVTLLSSGTFQRYREEKIKEGANLAHLKPDHMNPPKAVIQRLMEISSEK